MALIPFPKEPLRAIHVIPHSSDGIYCWAKYPGDEWTGEMRFEPPMKIATLLRELKACPQRCGLPIVILSTCKKEVAA